MTMMGLVERAVLRAVPVADREALLGDLAEERHLGASLSVGSRLRTLVGVAAYYQVEPYRDLRDRFAAVGLAGLGLVVLWLVSAAGGVSPTAETLARYDPASRAVLRFWSASSPIAAAATGLVLGRVPLLGAHAAAVRWHVGALLAGLAAVSAPGPAAATAATALLLSGLWLGSLARPDATPSAPTDGAGRGT